MIEDDNARRTDAGHPPGGEDDLAGKPRHTKKARRKQQKQQESPRPRPFALDYNSAYDDDLLVGRI